MTIESVLGDTLWFPLLTEYFGSLVVQHLYIKQEKSVSDICLACIYRMNNK